MGQQSIKVEIFTIPQAACDINKANWQQVAQMVTRQIKSKFGEVVTIAHIEFMSPEWFVHEGAQKKLESGELTFPFVLVDGEVVCAENKINLSKIKNFIDQKLRALLA